MVVEDGSTGVASSDVGVAVEGGAVVGPWEVLTGVASSVGGVALRGGPVVGSAGALTVAGSSESSEEHAAIAIAATTTTAKMRHVPVRLGLTVTLDHAS